jgi:hypothetical protein
LNVAHWYQETNTPGRFFVIDTDKAVSRMLGTSFAHLNNVEYGTALDWESCVELLKKYHEIAQQGDWFIVDMLGPQTWQFVRNYFNARTNPKAGDDLDLGEYLLELRIKAGKTSKVPISEVVGWDWTIVNRMYLGWVNTFVLKGNYHVFAAAGADAFFGDKEDKTTRVLFAAKGQKPKGMKEAPHLFHTILFIEAFRQGEPQFTTMKDRGRQPMDGELLNDFAMQYLCARAHWEFG